MAFDCIEFLERFSIGRDSVFNNVVYTSLILALVTILITFIILYAYMPDGFPIYMKWFIYLAGAYGCILALHYNGVRSTLEDQYKSGAYEELVSQTPTTPDEILKAEVE